jgi:hypothetical protein
MLNRSRGGIPSRLSARVATVLAAARALTVMASQLMLSMSSHEMW